MIMDVVSAAIIVVIAAALGLTVHKPRKTGG